MAVMDFELRLPPPEHLSGPLEGLQRARSFPKTQPTCCPGPSVNLLFQFPCVLHQLSSHQLSSHQRAFAISQRTDLLLIMLLHPVTPQLKRILNSVPFPRPRPRPGQTPLLENAVSTVPLLANPRKDGPRAGSQIYDPAHRTDWRRRIGAGYGGSLPGSATISLPSTPASSPTAVSGAGSSPNTCARISPVPESGLTQCAVHLS